MSSNIPRLGTRIMTKAQTSRDTQKRASYRFLGARHTLRVSDKLDLASYGADSHLNKK